MAAGDFPDTKLVMVGGCRSDVDKQFVEELKALAKKLSIQVRSDVLHGKLAAYHLAHVSPQRQDKVEFRINAPIEDLKELLATCSVGIHTMWNEHFGIGVVEMQAAGLVTIAHNSGGPKEDIVTPYHGSPTGFLAATVEEYCDAMRQAVCSPDGLKALRQNARDSTPRFSDEVFHNEFQCAFRPVLAGLGSAAAAVGAVKRD